MKRVLILIISIFTSWNIAEAQEAYQQAELFNRLAKEANASYKNTIDGLIEKVLERI